MVVRTLFPFPAVVVMGQQAFDRLTPDTHQTMRGAARDLPASPMCARSHPGAFPTRPRTAGGRHRNHSAAGRRAYGGG
jgi:hypothetical protein